ncbi:Antitoxin MqsA [compost metagenome]
MSHICPFCEVGELSEHQSADTMLYGGVRIPVEGVLYSACAACGEEVVLPEQAKANDIAYSDAKRLHDGLMTSVEISAWRDSWDLTQQRAAQLLGGGANAFSKYERGEVLQSKPMDLLIRLYADVPGVRTKLAEYAGIASGWVTSTIEETGLRVKSGPMLADVFLLDAYRDSHHALSMGCANDDNVRWVEQSFEGDLPLAVGER